MQHKREGSWQPEVMCRKPKVKPNRPEADVAPATGRSHKDEVEILGKRWTRALHLAGEKNAATGGYTMIATHDLVE